MKGHAGGGLPENQKADFFFDRNVHGGASSLAFSASDGNDFAWLAHARF